MTESDDEFGRAVAGIGVGQICEGVGFHGFQRSAAETLADIAIRYLSDLAKAAHFYANTAGRTECNAFDVILGMEDVCTGPSSAADPSRPLSHSKVLQDFMRYVEYSEEIPFPRPLPHFPVRKKRAAAALPSFAQVGETPPHPHIPSWLPAFPDPHTYKATPVWDERKSDPRIDKLEVAKQRRKAERSLVSLYLRLSSGRAAANGLSENEPPSSSTDPALATLALGTATDRHNAGASTSFQPSSSPRVSAARLQWPRQDEQAALISRLETEGQQGKGRGKRVVAGQNPYLASPLAAGEREVALVSFPGKRAADDPASQVRVPPDGKVVALPSALDAFSPALEAVKQQKADVVDNFPKSSSTKSTLVAKDRQPVLMSFDWGRKARRKGLSAQLSVGAFPGSPPSNNEKSKVVAAGKEEDKDDRKRRAEQILAQSCLEGSEDVAQT